MFRIPGLSQLKYVLEAAVRVDDAVGGLVQIVDDNEQVLRLHTWHGLSDAFAEAAETVALTEQTTCAQAARDRRHVVVRDVHADPSFKPYMLFAELGRFRSVQSTPLIDTQRRVVGVLTTQFAREHHPERESLLVLSACARMGARLVEACNLHAEISDADKRMGIPHRTLSPTAAQAADAARMLLPIIARDGNRALMESAERHLDTLIRELLTNTRKPPAEFARQA